MAARRANAGRPSPAGTPAGAERRLPDWRDKRAYVDSQRVSRGNKKPVKARRAEAGSAVPPARGGGAAATKRANSQDSTVEENLWRVSLYMMEQFIRARDCPRLGLDEDVLDFVAARFRKYIAADGKISLDAAFDLKLQERGATPVVKRAALYIRNRDWLDEMCQLIAIGLTIDQAAVAVARRVGKISDKRLRAICYAAGGMNYVKKRGAYDKARAWSCAKRRKFLESFPKDSLPLNHKELCDKPI